jgi:pilus assembly protein CpaE
MLGEMDAKHAVVQSMTEIAHVLTGRNEVKAKKKPGIADLLDRVKSLKAKK